MENIMHHDFRCNTTGLVRLKLSCASWFWRYSSTNCWEKHPCYRVAHVLGFPLSRKPSDIPPGRHASPWPPWSLWCSRCGMCPCGCRLPVGRQVRTYQAAYSPPTLQDVLNFFWYKHFFPEDLNSRAARKRRRCRPLNWSHHLNVLLLQPFLPSKNLQPFSLDVWNLEFSGRSTIEYLYAS